MSLVVVASLPEWCPVCAGDQAVILRRYERDAFVVAEVDCPHCTSADRLPVALLPAHRETSKDTA